MPYLPKVCRIYIWREPLRRNSSTFIRSNPCAQGNVLPRTNPVTRPRDTRYAEMYFIWKWSYGVCEPGFLEVGFCHLFLRRWRFWNSSGFLIVTQVKDFHNLVWYQSWNVDGLSESGKQCFWREKHWILELQMRVTNTDTKGWIELNPGDVGDIFFIVSFSISCQQLIRCPGPSSLLKLQSWSHISGDFIAKTTAKGNKEGKRILVMSKTMSLHWRALRIAS